MRTVYLIRHAAPALPGGKRICLSRTDLPLSEEGLAQSKVLTEAFSAIPLTGVYCSPLTRCVQTAGFLAEYPQVVSDLEELGVGEWEGLTFDEIRRRFPEEYRLRGEDPVRHLIPGGENPLACRDRAMSAVHQLLRETQGDIAIVSHAGVNRLLLCTLLDRELQTFLQLPQPYGCVNILRWQEERLWVEEVGLLPEEIKIRKTKGGSDFV